MTPLEQLVAEEAAALERFTEAEARQAEAEKALSEAKSVTMEARAVLVRARVARSFAQTVAELHGFVVPAWSNPQTYAVKAIEGRWVRFVKITQRQISDTWAGCFDPHTTDLFVDRATGLEKGARSSRWRPATPPIPLDVLNREVVAFEARAGGGA